MIRLSEDELENGFRSIERHGYSSFFPKPPEMDAIKTNWDEVRRALSEIDLADTFRSMTGDEKKAVKTTAFDLQMNPASPRR